MHTLAPPVLMASPTEMWAFWLGPDIESWLGGPLGRS